MSESKSGSKEKIIIDKDLEFSSEDDLYAYFAKEIETLEEVFESQRDPKDFADDRLDDLASFLEPTLDDPDEIWEDPNSLPGRVIYNFVRTFVEKDRDIHYIAVCYMSEETPTFVYLHFGSMFKGLLNHYRKEQIVYSRSFRDTEICSIEGDALGEGDELAIGLCHAMLKVRQPGDIDLEKFSEYAELREEAIEEADEIWRNTDLDGNVLVSFIREYSDVEENLHYVVVTVEEPDSKVHSLLFSFPTTDVGLVDRYRHGENLQAEEVTQESSH